MSLPLGHAVIGLTVYDSTSDSADPSVFRSWKVAAMVVVLSNLPDIDILFGLLYSGNGGLFHRGPTHSIFFACIMGLIAANGWRIWKGMPRVRFHQAFILIASHLAADFFFTDAPLSLLWPFELSLSSGFQSWGDVIHSVVFRALNDIAAIMICTIVIIFRRLFRLAGAFFLLPEFARKRK
jgi:membrane-bound metal-dependent hydrolase YbcI (DUF457 family)